MSTKAPSFPRTRHGLEQAKATRLKRQEQREARGPENRFARMKQAETKVQLSAFTAVEKQTKRFTISLDSDNGFAAAARVFDGQKQVGIADNKGEFQWFDYVAEDFENSAAVEQLERQFSSIAIHSMTPEYTSSGRSLDIHSAHQ